jgi:hypothetical protein
VESTGKTAAADAATGESSMRAAPAASHVAASAALGIGRYENNRRE